MFISFFPMTRNNIRDKKIALLELIAEEKDSLFSKSSSAISTKTKQDSWKNVLEKAKSLGLVAESRDWKFVRDKVFGVWKARALNKRDNARRTGKGGGKR